MAIWLSVVLYGSVTACVMLLIFIISLKCPAGKTPFWGSLWKVQYGCFLFYALLTKKAVCKAEDQQEAEAMRSRAVELRTVAEQAAALAGSHAESLGPAPDTADGPSATFRLGEVVWAREKGWPAWPAVVITRESARDLSPLSKLPSS